MATDLTVMLPHRPGALADLGEATAAAGLNVDGVCGIVGAESEAAVHVLVEDGAAGRRALEEAGLPVAAEREVVVVDCEDRPGELARVSRALGDAGVNVELVYLATRTRLVVGAPDLSAARQALEA